MRDKKGLSGSTLKMIAMASMVIDHTAYVVLGAVLIQNGIFSVQDYTPGYLAGMIQSGSIGWIYLAYQLMRRVAGRIAFPIFCFLLVEGFEKTRSRSRYASRLLLFALLSEIPFDLVFSFKMVDQFSQNVLFTLLIGFLAMWGMEKMQNACKEAGMQIFLQIMILLGAGFLAERTFCDYGAYGIIAIGLLYLFRRNKREQILAGCISFIWELPALLSFIPIALYNGKRGAGQKFVFYVFYPMHLLVLYWILRVCF